MTACVLSLASKIVQDATDFWEAAQKKSLRDVLDYEVWDHRYEGIIVHNVWEIVDKHNKNIHAAIDPLQVKAQEESYLLHSKAIQHSIDSIQEDTDKINEIDSEIKRLSKLRKDTIELTSAKKNQAYTEYTTNNGDKLIELCNLYATTAKHIITETFPKIVAECKDEINTIKTKYKK